jgi:hypothetical protein
LKFHECQTSPTVPDEPPKRQIPDDLNAWLARSAAAAALNATGYPISSDTLATMASRGGGPQFSKWGSRALYRWRDVLEWAESRLSEPIRSTSESDSCRLAEHSSRPVVDVRCAPISRTVSRNTGAGARVSTRGGGGPHDESP